METDIFCHVVVHILNRDKKKSHFYTFVVFLSVFIVSTIMSENHVLLANEIYSDLSSFSVSQCIIISIYVHTPCIQETNGVQQELLCVLQLLGHYFCDGIPDLLQQLISYMLGEGEVNIFCGV
jgi:hypothetical protein